MKFSAGSECEMFMKQNGSTSPHYFAFVDEHGFCPFIALERTSSMFNDNMFSILHVFGCITGNVILYNAYNIRLFKYIAVIIHLISSKMSQEK